MTLGAEYERLLSKYSIAADSNCAWQLRAYVDLLDKWNRRINLVSSTSWNTLGPLLEEAIWAGRRYPAGTVRHLDIGSGAGFPALPMRLLNPDMRLRMVESRTRRAAFLETAIETMGLERAHVHSGRLESYLAGDEAAHGWDCVSWKALKLDTRSLSQLIQMADVGAEFWIFQGREIPVHGGELDTRLLLSESAPVPGKPAWRLSVFRKHLS